MLFAGISLPAAYLKRRMKDLTVLLLPIMACAWLVSSALIIALLPNLSWIEALCIVRQSRQVRANVTDTLIALSHCSCRARLSHRLILYWQIRS